MRTVSRKKNLEENAHKAEGFELGLESRFFFPGYFFLEHYKNGRCQHKKLYLKSWLEKNIVIFWISILNFI